MRVRTIVDGQDVSHRVLQGEGVKVQVAIEDDDGKQSINSATITLGNINGDLDHLIGRSDRVDIQIVADTTTIFRGFVSPVENGYDMHNRRLELKVMHKEADAIALLKSRTFVGGNNWPGNTILRKQIFTQHQQVVVERRFVAVNDVLSRIASAFNFGYVPNPIFSNVVVGGTIFDEHFAPFCDGWTYYDFISRFSTALNCLWRYNTATNRLEVVPKIQVVNILSVPEVVLRMKRDTPDLSLTSVGADMIVYRYSNQPSASRAQTEATRKKSGNISIVREVDIDFTAPTFGAGSNIANAHIEQEEQDVGTYLMYSTGSLPSESLVMPASNILNAYHAIELFGTDRIEGELSLSDATAAQLLSLSNGFYTKFGSPGFATYYLTNADIDWQERTVRITGVRYANPG